MGLMTIGAVACWALLIVGIVLLVRSVGRSSPPTDRTPEQLLAERFARGEIDPENESG